MRHCLNVCNILTFVKYAFCYGHQTVCLLWPSKCSLSPWNSSEMGGATETKFGTRVTQGRG